MINTVKKEDDLKADIMMTFNSKTFVMREGDFLKKYKGKNTFVKDSKYYQYFLVSLEDTKLYEHIVFCNDVLGIPPIYVLIMYYRDQFSKKMTAHEKQGLGACLGFLFKEIFGYKGTKTVWVGEQKTGVKKASYFIK